MHPARASCMHWPLRRPGLRRSVPGRAHQMFQRSGPVISVFGPGQRTGIPFPLNPLFFSSFSFFPVFLVAQTAKRRGSGSGHFLGIDRTRTFRVNRCSVSGVVMIHSYSSLLLFSLFAHFDAPRSAFYAGLPVFYTHRPFPPRWKHGLNFSFTIYNTTFPV